MTLRLHRDWRRILARAWSVRLMALALLFGAVEAAVPWLHGVLPISEGAFAALSFAATLAAGVARLVGQANMEDGA